MPTPPKKLHLGLDSVFFSTPEQKVLRLLLSEPPSPLTPRILASKLKGIRGLGGIEGILKILLYFQELGLIDFIDNHRAVRVQDDNTSIQILKTFVAICDLEGLKTVLQPISIKGILLGSRTTREIHIEGNSYNLFIVSETPEEVKKMAGRHPMGRTAELVIWTPELYGEIKKQDPTLHQKVSKGIVLWGSTW